MKLVCCVTCNEVFSLAREYKECKGGHGGGQYIDSLNAKVWGPVDEIFVLGFANSTLVSALRSQIADGDSDTMMNYAGQYTPRGREFTAFIIPDAAASVARIEGKFIPN